MATLSKMLSCSSRIKYHWWALSGQLQFAFAWLFSSRVQCLAQVSSHRQISHMSASSVTRTVVGGRGRLLKSRNLKLCMQYVYHDNPDLQLGQA